MPNLLSHTNVILFSLIAMCAGCSTFYKTNSKIYVRRFSPGQDLKLMLRKWAEDEGLRAASVVSAVGSLNHVTIRYADQKSGSIISGPLEIVSLTGTLSKNSSHLHIAVSNQHGQTLGGHLLEGSSIFTTVEVTIIEASGLEFQRIKDEQTGFEELSISTH